MPILRPKRSLNMRILLAAINAKYIHSNLAIRYLKGYAKRRISSEISLAEYTINQYVDEILAGIYAQKPDILGFSCYLWNIDYVRKLTVLIKKVLPETIIIWEGLRFHTTRVRNFPYLWTL